jgi:hypothetical protein
VRPNPGEASSAPEGQRRGLPGSELLGHLLQQVVAPALASVSLDALPVGIQEDGEPYRLQLLGTHLLLVGATGAGKSSVRRHRSRIGCATASNQKFGRLAARRPGLGCDRDTDGRSGHPRPVPGTQGSLLKRLPTLAEVADTAVFIASDRAGAITATVAKPQRRRGRRRSQTRHDQLRIQPLG